MKSQVGSQAYISVRISSSLPAAVKYLASHNNVAIRNMSAKKTSAFEFKTGKRKPTIYVIFPLNLPTNVYMRSVVW